MEKYRQFRVYAKEVNSGQRNPPCTLSYYLQDEARKAYLWYNVEEYKKVTLPKKVLHYGIYIVIFIHYFLMCLDMKNVEINVKSLPKLLTSLSLMYGGFMVLLRWLSCIRHREKLDYVLRTLNEKFLAAIPICEKETLQTYNKYHVVLSGMVGFVCYWLSFYFFVLVVIYSLATGEPYLKLLMPYPDPKYSATWWFEVFFNAVVLVYSVPSFALLEGTLVDIAMQIHFLHRVQYERLQAITATTENVNDILRSFFREIQDLRQ